jgi:hypothetical protein
MRIRIFSLKMQLWCSCWLSPISVHSRRSNDEVDAVVDDKLGSESGGKVEVVDDDARINDSIAVAVAVAVHTVDDTAVAVTVSVDGSAVGRRRPAVGSLSGKRKKE